MQVFTPLQVKPALSLRGAPADMEVRISMTGLPMEALIYIGFGGIGAGGHEIIGQTETDEEGAFSIPVHVPKWPDPNRIYFFFVTFADQSPRAFSEPFLVTKQDGTVRLRGRISDEAAPCVAIRGPGAELYTLEGEVGDWAPGARVIVTGTVATESACGGGIPIAVSGIETT